MKIYRMAQQQDTDYILWKCPNTNIEIKAPRVNKKIIEYSVFIGDSFFDAFDNWYDARNEAEEINRNCSIPRAGKLKNYEDI